MIINIDHTDEFYNRIIEDLRNGHIIAIPTDTIYGFAVDGSNPDAVKRLAEIKARDEKPFTVFLARGELDKYVRIVKRKIIEYFVPGPLTVILKKRPEIHLAFIIEKIGIRIPRVNFIVKLLNLYSKPLAVTSANLAGQKAIDTADEIAGQFADISLVINGGKLISRPSTVVDLTTTPLTVKRKGVIPILEIEKVYGRNVEMETPLRFNVLFVCSGNSCRSPMAQGILKTLVSEAYCEVKSAGTLSMGSLPASQYAQDVVEEYGGSITQHLSQTVTKELIDWADVIFVMSYTHYNYILDISPAAAVKTFFLKEYKRKVKYNEVSDPVGKDYDAYKQTARDMMPSLTLIARDIKRRFQKG